MRVSAYPAAYRASFSLFSDTQRRTRPADRLLASVNEGNHWMRNPENMEPLLVTRYELIDTPGGPAGTYKLVKSASHCMISIPPFLDWNEDKMKPDSERSSDSGFIGLGSNKDVIYVSSS